MKLTQSSEFVTRIEDRNGHECYSVSADALNALYAQAEYITNAFDERHPYINEYSVRSVSKRDFRKARKGNHFVFDCVDIELPNRAWLFVEGSLYSRGDIFTECTLIVHGSIVSFEGRIVSLGSLKTTGTVGVVHATKNIRVSNSLLANNNVHSGASISVGGDLQSGFVSAEGDIRCVGSISCSFASVEAGGDITCDGHILANGIDAGRNVYCRNSGASLEGFGIKTPTLLAGGSVTCHGEIHISDYIDVVEDLNACGISVENGRASCGRTLKSNGDVVANEINAGGSITVKGKITVLKCSSGCSWVLSDRSELPAYKDTVLCAEIQADCVETSDLQILALNKIQVIFD